MPHPILVIIQIIETVEYRENNHFWLSQLAKIILPPESEARNDSFNLGLILSAIHPQKPETTRSESGLVG
jgi:hypothetical protein